MFTLLDLCVSSLRRGHANLLCIVPILTDDPRRESEISKRKRPPRSFAQLHRRGARASAQSSLEKKGKPGDEGRIAQARETESRQTI